MTSVYSGAVVRTTHVTGLFTDLGITIGLWFRGQTADRRRVVLYLTLIMGFILGGLFGAFSFASFRFYALVAPVTMCALMAVAYLFYRLKNKEQSSHQN
jgi:uncharacterized membrane protein YoaK (UPF0700 family)